MARFFMTGTNIFGGRAVIRGQDAEHIRVLRMRPGEDVVICDGKGTDYRCRLVSSGPEEAEAEVLEVVPCRGEPGVEVTVYAGLPKGERADFLIQKSVEAGASGVVFFNCERCIARPDGRSMEKKLERFSRIAEAAAQQSGRGRIPRVEYEHSYVEMLGRAVKAEARLFMYETGEDRVRMQVTKWAISSNVREEKQRAAQEAAAKAAKSKKNAAKTSGEENKIDEGKGE